MRDLPDLANLDRENLDYVKRVNHAINVDQFRRTRRDEMVSALPGGERLDRLPAGSNPDGSPTAPPTSRSARSSP